jgi:hypothetical protein
MHAYKHVTCIHQFIHRYTDHIYTSAHIHACMSACTQILLGAMRMCALTYMYILGTLYCWFHCTYLMQLTCLSHAAHVLISCSSRAHLMRLTCLSHAAHVLISCGSHVISCSSRAYLTSMETALERECFLYSWADQQPR